MFFCFKKCFEGFFKCFSLFKGSVAFPCFVFQFFFLFNGFFFNGFFLQGFFFNVFFPMEVFFKDSKRFFFSSLLFLQRDFCGSFFPMFLRVLLFFLVVEEKEFFLKIFKGFFFLFKVFFFTKVFFFSKKIKVFSERFFSEVFFV